MSNRNAFTPSPSSSSRLSIFIALCMLAVWLTTTSSFGQSIPESSGASQMALSLKHKIASLEDQITAGHQYAKENDIRLSKLMAARDVYFEQQDGLGVSRESFADVLKTLQSQRVQLMIDLAGMDARRESLTQIKEKQLVEKLDSTVLELYTKLIELQLKKRDQAKALAARGSKPAAEVRDAEIEYVNAQLKLANAKSSIKVSPRINEELLNVSLDRAEKKARLEKTEKLLATFIESRTSLLKSDEIKEDILAAKRKQISLQANLENLNAVLKAANHELEQVLNNQF